MKMTNTKIVRLQPSPFVKTNLKIKMAQPKTNSAGFAMKDNKGRLMQSDVDVNDALRVPGTSKTIAPVLSSNGLKTGLNKIVDNPYKDEKTYHPAWGEKIFKGKDKASLQHILEYKHNKELDYYSGNHMDKIIASNSLHEQPFFLTDKCKLRLDGNVVFLNLNNPLDEVRYYMVLDHYYVANSFEDLEEGKNTTAGYYIVDENEIKDIKLREIKKTTKASSAMDDMDSKEESVLINMALALGLEDKTPSKEKSFKYIHSYWNESEENYAIFMKYYDMYKDKARRDRFIASALVQDLINYSIIRQRDNKFYWVMPETDDHPMKTFEWSTKDKLISEFILAPEYQEEYSIMKSILDSRK